MHFTFIDMLMVALVLASMSMGASFTTLRQKGNTFVAAFDRSALWGGGIFVAGILLAILA